LWNVESGEEVRRFAAIEYIVYTEKDKKIERTAKKGASDFALYCVAVSADGSLLAAGGADKTIRIWDRNSGELRLTIEGHNDYIYGLNFVEPNRLASLGHTGKVYLWSVADGAAQGAIKLPAFALQFAVSSNRDLLAVGCADAHAYVIKVTDATN
jgi:WD40 repeat protein